ncbi:trypsin-like serine peptidase [Paractinoplanes rishiriensis]|uniref:Serine protease n=1 Tax=Paractinoplanes rishiriensis TaxID=1050105 RepID=A0A919MW55_9ACTN|nr:trypsin-like peptidase domain-containing protein [Actinoplanes rishiriensis]GIF02127.1 hypothetical protein Ari01nite_95910 [Actinoplanes rishiriensis]
MSHPNNDGAEMVRRLVVSRSVAQRSGVPLESVGPAEVDGVGPDAGAVVDRVAAALERAEHTGLPEAAGDRAAFWQAREIVLHETRQVCAKLDEDPDAPLDDDDLLALEAIIRIDGSRPCLPIRGGSFDPVHPFAGVWSSTLAAVQPRLYHHIAAVGRIEPEGATADTYFGTGWVVDSARGLVLTNWHVVDGMCRSKPPRVVVDHHRHRVVGNVFVDFVCESASTATNRFQVVDIRVPGPAGSASRRLDAAVLIVEPATPTSRMPTAIPLRADLDGPRGLHRSLCAVGFPGWSQLTSGRGRKVNWKAVYAGTFGDAMGVKHLSPGRVHTPIPASHACGRAGAFGHDLTTMHGSSGSPIIAWLQAVPTAFGLHFGGENTGDMASSNYAHAFSEAADAFRALGVLVE